MSAMDDIDYCDMQAVRDAEEDVFARAMQAAFPCAASIPEAVPERLRSARAWFVWAAAEAKVSQSGKMGKPRKLPLIARGHSPYFARWKDPDSPVAFHEAMRFLERHGGRVYQGPDGMPFLVLGLEFRLDVGLGIVGVDLDDCLDDAGQPRPAVAPLLQDLLAAQMYIERSPSGHGLRAFCPGPLPPCFAGPSVKKKLESGIGVEVYVDRRLLTVTGRAWPGCSAQLVSHPLQAACLERIYAMAMAAPQSAQRPVQPTPAVRVPAKQLPSSDAELLEKAFSMRRNGAELAEIWNSTAAQDHANGYDASARDVTLVNALAWWVGPDPVRLDSILRTSPRLLDPARLAKWDCPKRVDNMTYGEALCRTACKGLTSWYRDGSWKPKWPKWRRKKKPPQEDSGSGPVPR